MSDLVGNPKTGFSRIAAYIVFIYHLTGVILISLALCCDGAIGNFQEKVLKQYGAANSEIVSWL